MAKNNWGNYVGQNVQATTEKISDDYAASALHRETVNVSAVTQDTINAVGKLPILTLSKAWIGIGLIRPARTEDNLHDPRTSSALRNLTGVGSMSALDTASVHREIQSESSAPDSRFKRERLYSLQLGEYFMPLSQTFTLKAKKKLNISSLVDGVDIIQQTRKEAKTIECTLRIGLRGVHNLDDETYEISPSVNKNLQIVNANNEIQRLQQFLDELYETDSVFVIENAMINDTFKVTHVIMSDYRFSPRVGMGTYTFEFSLTEVKYGDNVLTMDLTKLNSTPTTITGD